jgi:uracil-DNA glycosylase
LHDLVHLERRGIPAVAVATEPFADEAIEQARRLRMPGARVVYIPHPVQLLTDEELTARADDIFPAVLAALTAAGLGAR